MTKIKSKILILSLLLVSLSLQLQIRQNHHHNNQNLIPLSSLNNQNFNGQIPNQSNYPKIHAPSQSFKHFAASSMQINYTQQILKLNPKFKPAANINERISHVQNSNLDHDDKVRLLSSFTFSSFESDPIDCKNLSLNLIQALLYRTSQMRTYLENSLGTNQVNFLNNVSEKQSAKQGLQNEVIYLKGLENFFESGCSKRILLSQTFYLSNPNAKNWILGEWSYNDFVKSYIAAVNNETNVNKCPLQKPFYDPTSQNCVNCQYPNNVWSMKQQRCVACPYAQVVNLKTRRCVSEIRYVNNIMDQNYDWITKEKSLQKVYDQFKRQNSKQNSVVCPFDTPFILNEKCSTCPENYVYFLQERKCFSVPYNMEYDRNLHRVVQKLHNYQTSEGISSNIEPGLKGCPTQLPYYDNITCIDCQFPNYFNERRRKCEPCLNLDVCVGKKINYITNSLGSNLTARSTKEVKDYFLLNGQKIKDDSVYQCPIDTPYYNPAQRKCIQCLPETNLFNISSLTCAFCPEKTFFNQNSYLCQSLKGVKTNSNAQFLIVQDIQKYNEQQSKITGPQCSQIVPYFNGIQCQVCQKGQFFDTSSKSCVNCPPDTAYDNVLMKCDKINYKTYALADRLWIDNLVSYQAVYQYNKAKQCPETQPFYNGTACTSCLPEEIFNTSSLTCTKCPVGTTYDNINKNCAVLKANVYLPGRIDNLLGVPSYLVDAYLNQFNYLDKTSFNVIKCGDNENSLKTGCVKCMGNYTFFNVRTLECVQCKQLDKQRKICYDNMTFLTNTTKKDKFLGGKEGDIDRYVKEQQNKLKQTLDLYRVCSADNPYSIKGVCKNCEKYFNVSSSQCVSCDYFDDVSKTCVVRPYVSNLKYGVPAYYTSNSTKLIEEYDTAIKKGTPVCLFTTPFFNGNECMACPKTDDYFNLDLKRCENCTEGFKLNPIINECQEEPPKFYTALESQKLIFDGQPISYYEYKIEQAKKTGSKPCPKDKPYYTMNNQCEVCNKPTEYFNLLRRRCTSCLPNTKYTSTDHECVSPIGDVITPQATLEKSLANLFT